MRRWSGTGGGSARGMPGTERTAAARNQRTAQAAAESAGPLARALQSHHIAA